MTWRHIKLMLILTNKPTKKNVYQDRIDFGCFLSGESWMDWDGCCLSLTKACPLCFACHHRWWRKGVGCSIVTKKQETEDTLYRHREETDGGNGFLLMCFSPVLCFGYCWPLLKLCYLCVSSCWQFLSPRSVISVGSYNNLRLRPQVISSNIWTYGIWEEMMLFVLCWSIWGWPICVRMTKWRHHRLI